jgi:hypothetical protein
MAILVVAQAWDSGYEQASHELIGRDAGLTEAELDALRAGEDPKFADEQESAAYAAVRALTGPARPGRRGVRGHDRGPGRGGPGRAVDPGRLLRHPGPAAAHLPGPKTHVSGRPWTYDSSGTWEWEPVPELSSPPVGLTMNLSDQIRPVQRRYVFWWLLVC